MFQYEKCSHKMARCVNHHPCQLKKLSHKVNSIQTRPIMLNMAAERRKKLEASALNWSYSEMRLQTLLGHKTCFIYPSLLKTCFSPCMNAAPVSCNDSAPI